MNIKKRNTVVVVILIAVILVIALVPLLVLKGAEFGGSDDAGSEMAREITGEGYEPWFEPVLETMIGGELPEEAETLLLCVQTGIGTGVIAFCFGYLAARKKYSGGNTGQSETEKGES